MATMQRLRPCPNCNSDDNLAVYKYDNGWCHVECDKCHYLGPGEGSKVQAASAYNERQLAGAILAQHGLET